jgi:hypothetical protein
MRNAAIGIGITLLFMAYLFASLRKIYGQSVVATSFKMIIIYGVTQSVVIVTLAAVIVVAVVRAAKAH